MSWGVGQIRREVQFSHWTIVMRGFLHIFVTISLAVDLIVSRGDWLNLTVLTNMNKCRCHSPFLQELFDCEVGPYPLDTAVRLSSSGLHGGIWVQKHHRSTVLSLSKWIVIQVRNIFRRLQLMSSVDWALLKCPQLLEWRFQCHCQRSFLPPQSQTHCNIGWSLSGLDSFHRHRSLSHLSTEERPPPHRNPVHIQYGNGVFNAYLSSAQLTMMEFIHGNVANQSVLSVFPLWREYGSVLQYLQL